VPQFVLGVATIRGSPTPIIAAAQLLGLDAGRPTRLVTIKIRDRIAAIAVDEVLGVRMIQADSLAGVPPLLRDASPGVVATIASLDAELMLVLEASHVVPESVWNTLEPASTRR
jgi:purine-binding chemotaxis protein CheW